MARIDFTEKTRDVVAKRAGYRCSNPECRAQTVGPHSEAGRFVTLGVASHIIAASPGGPRADQSLTEQAISGISNAIWLCCPCSTLIDKDEARFPISELLDWKANREKEVLNELESGRQSIATGRLLKVSAPMKMGSTGSVRLLDGSAVPTLPLADLTCNPATQLMGLGYRFIVKPTQAQQSTVLHGLWTEVVHVEPIPQYQMLCGLFPKAYSLFILPIGDPQLSNTNRFMATHYYQVRQDETTASSPFTPFSIDTNEPEIIDCRIAPLHSGLFTFRIFAVVSVGTDISEEELLGPTRVIVFEFSNQSGQAPVINTIQE